MKPMLSNRPLNMSEKNCGIENVITQTPNEYRFKVWKQNREREREKNWIIKNHELWCAKLIISVPLQNIKYDVRCCRKSLSWWTHFQFMANKKILQNCIWKDELKTECVFKVLFVIHTARNTIFKMFRKIHTQRFEFSGNEYITECVFGRNCVLSALYFHWCEQVRKNLENGI